MTLAITYSDLQKEVARELGWPRDPNEWSSTQDADFELILNAGLRKFYSGELPGERAHNWTFLYPAATLELTPQYTTGTIAVSSGTVTLTTGTWPSWAAQGELWFSDGSSTVRHEVATRSSDSVVTIADTTVTASAGTTYKLKRIFYDLPSDFGGMYSDGFTYRRDTDLHLPDIYLVGEADIRRVDRDQAFSIYPRCAALVPNGAGAWQVRFYPLSEATYYLDYRYKVDPPKLTTTNTTPYGGGFAAEAIVAAVLHTATQRVHGSNERQGEFYATMRQAILHDKRNFTIKTAGFGVTDPRRGTLSLYDVRRQTSIVDANLFT